MSEPTGSEPTVTGPTLTEPTGSEPTVTGGTATAADRPTGAPAAPAGLSILPVTGLPDIRPGDDLAAMIDAACPWLTDGDVLVVTSKIISKAEGRLVPSPTDPVEREQFRRDLIDSESVRLVAEVARTKIVENRLGLVAAAAGIDASNVHSDEIALLPQDPDDSAARMVDAFAARGRRVGVVISDTQGRAWRLGVTDVCIGAAGVSVVDDHRGGVDEHGNELVVTVVAVADEVAAAADLVKGKLSGVPVAVLRGMDAPGRTPGAGGDGARSLIRPIEEDLFRLGTDLAIAQGRREAVLLDAGPPVAGEPVDPAAIDAAVSAAARAGDSGVRFVVVDRHLDALRQALAGSRSLETADILGGSSVLLALVHDPDPPALVAGGAALAVVRTALLAEGLAAALDDSPARYPAVVRAVLELSDDWYPVGAICVGHPAVPPGPLAPPAVQVLWR